MFQVIGLALGLAAAPAAGAAEAEAGEARISIDVKDAAIQDVLRLLAEVGGFQMVLDPGVTCRLTLKLSQVRWPAVLQLALKSCGLASEEADGVYRIATAARLTQEAADRARLQELQRLHRPRTLTTRTLSYARAEELAPVVQRMLRPGGEVLFDRRTNTLIIID